jgi:hypothetical protein
MRQGEGGHDTWWRRHFGAGAWADTTPSQRVAWVVLGGAGSAVLLGAFWLVLNQALARADQHWEQARNPVSSAAACGPSRTLGAGGEACASAVADSVGRHAAGSVSTRLNASPR